MQAENAHFTGREVSRSGGSEDGVCQNGGLGTRDGALGCGIPAGRSLAVAAGL
jgi:hypothetical protein